MSEKKNLSAFGLDLSGITAPDVPVLIKIEPQTGVIIAVTVVSSIAFGVAAFYGVKKLFGK